MVPVKSVVVGEERNARFAAARGEVCFDGSNIKGAESWDIAVGKRLDTESVCGGGSRGRGRGDRDVDVRGTVGEPAEFGIEFLWRAGVSIGIVVFPLGTEIGNK